VRVLFLPNISFLIFVATGRGIIFDVANRYGLDGPGVEFGRERDFPHPSIPARGPNQPPVQQVPGLFPRSKAARAWL
jgi:hypothetical protein